MAESENQGSLISQYSDPDYRDPELEAFRKEYGAYQGPQAADPDDYGWGITAAFARGFERLRALPDVAQGDYEELAGHYQAMEESAISPEDQARLEEIRNTPGFWAKAGELLEDPRLIMQTVAESLPMMAAPIAGAFGGGLGGGAAGTAIGGPVGGAIGGAGGAMVGGGVGSYLTEYMNAMAEFFGEHDVDMKNPAQLKAAFEDPNLMAGARDWAHKRGVPIAIFDAVSMGLAGRVAKPVAGMTRKVTGKSLGLGGATEIGMQAGFGMAGEAGAQLNTEGEITDQLDVLLEGFGEIVPGFAEAGVTKFNESRAAKKEGTPETSPLAALDVPEDQRPPWSGIPETDIDPETGKPVTLDAKLEQLGDRLYDDLGEVGPNTPEPDEMETLLSDLGEQLAQDIATYDAKIEADIAAEVAREEQMLEMENERAGRLAQARAREQQGGDVDVQTEILVAEEEYTNRINGLRALLTRGGRWVVRNGKREWREFTPKERARIEQSLAAYEAAMERLQVHKEHEANRGWRRRREEEEAYRQRELQDIEAPGAAESEMVTPEGIEVEGQPVDVAGTQPSEEGQILADGTINPVGGRPLTGSLGEALRGAGIVPPDDDGPTGGGGAPAAPERGPDVPTAESEAAEILAAEAEIAEANRILRESSAVGEAQAEREAIQAEADMPAQAEPDYDDIPFFEETAPAEVQPAVEWADERLATEEGRGTLDVMMNDVQAGGGVALVPDQDYAGGESDKRNDDGTYEAPMKRTPSTNPPWFQSIVANEGVGMKEVQNAIDKAKEGKRLGARQKRIIKAMLDEYAEQEAQYQPPPSVSQIDTPMTRAENTVNELETAAAERRAFSKRVPDENELAEVEEVLTDRGWKGDPLNERGQSWDNKTINEYSKDGQSIVVREEITVGPGVGGYTLEVKGQAKAREKGKAETQSDMFGAPSQTEQTVADMQRARERRERNAPDADTGALNDLFTAQQTQDQATAQTDVEDVAPALTEVQQKNIDELHEGEDYLLAEAKSHRYSIYAARENGKIVFDVLDDIDSFSKHDSYEEAYRAYTDLVSGEVAGLETGEGKKKTTAEKIEEGRQESIDNGHVAYVEKLRASGSPTDSLIADIEDQHEEWRIFRAYVEDLSWSSPLSQDEIDANNVRLDRLADMGETKKAMELAKDMDHWLHKERIQAKSSDERYKKSRKSNKYGGATHVNGRNSISMSIDTTSYTVSYDTLTFKSPEDKARIDRILELGERKPSGTPTENFVLDEANFDREGPDTNERVFDNDVEPNKRVAIDTRLKREGNKYISLEEADERITAWEQHAIDQGKQSREIPHRGPEAHKDNSNRVIISLFDTTGVWANPYALAGYDVRTLDIKDGIDVTDFSVDFMDRMFNNFEGKEIYGVLAACPCTTFTNSSTKWRKDRHENTDPVESRKWIEEMWGKKAAEAVDEDGNWLYASAHDYAVSLVNKTMQTLEYFRPKFWVLENPEGRIEQAANLPGPWRTGFQPNNFGDPYTKRTLLWGNFNEDLPTANVEPTEGSKMHKMSPSVDRAAKRAETPEGFAYSFFMANNYLDMDPVDRTKADYWYVEGAIEEAFRAGVTEEKIRDNVYLEEAYEPDEDTIEGAKETLRALIAEVQGGPPAPPSPYSKAAYRESTPSPAAPAAPEAPGVREIKLSPSINQVKGITQARLKRIANNLAKFPEVIEKIDSRTGIRLHLDVLWVSVHDDTIRVNSVDRSGIARGGPNTSPMSEYASRKVTHIKEALIALDKKLQDKIKYAPPTSEEIETAAAEADPESATDAQKKAGNYKKGHMFFSGFDVTIENPIGSKRFGNMKMRDHYGYIKRTEGADGDHIDVFINKDTPSDFEGDVYIVDQLVDGKASGGFDEHKVMLGYNNMLDAKRAYKRNFTKGWTMGPVTKMKMSEFFRWIREPGANNRPAAESNVTEAGSKKRAAQNKKLKHAIGKSKYNAPTEAWLESVLEGGPNKMGDVPDTMPLNVAVSELLSVQREQDAARQQATTSFEDTVINERLEEGAQERAGIQEPGTPDPGIVGAAGEKRLSELVTQMNKAFPLANIHVGDRNDPAVLKDLEEKGLADFENAIGNLTTPALYDPNTGKIWIFKDRLPDLYGTKKLIMHEMTHRGLDVMFNMHENAEGMVLFNRLMSDIYDRVPAKHKAKLKRIEAEYGLDSTVREDNWLAAEELVAALAESGVKDSIVAKVVQFIRNFLENIGIITSEDAWSNQDIRDLIAEAHGALTGKPRNQNATITEEVVLESTGEIFEVERSANDAIAEVDQRIEICKKLRGCL